MTRRAPRTRAERGMAAVWTLLLAAGAFTLLLGFVVDGGAAIDARLEAKRAAEQAARAGADALSAPGVRSGTSAIDPEGAAVRAHRILQQAGWRGTVAVEGETVRVTANGSEPTLFLSVIGIGSFAVHETGSATGITQPGPP